MFTFFRRKRDKPSALHGVLQQIGSAIERKKRKAADYLNSKTKDWSDRQILTGFLLLSVFLGGGGVVAVRQSFHQPARIVRIQSVRMPEHGLQTPREAPREAVLSNAAINNILSFRHHLDSLQQTTTGKRLYDSITQYRPGLLDSLAFIEKTYQQQLKTSEDERKK